MKQIIFFLLLAFSGFGQGISELDNFELFKLGLTKETPVLEVKGDTLIVTDTYTERVWVQYGGTMVTESLPRHKTKTTYLLNKIKVETGQEVEKEKITTYKEWEYKE